jgi:VWFA-related protein
MRRTPNFVASTGMLGASAMVFGAILYAQTTVPPTPAPTDASASEMTTRDSPATFRTKVNLVLVPVVVRDRVGHAVGTLQKEDFQLFDKGKPQVISRFSIESGRGSETKLQPDGAAGTLEPAPASAKPAAAPPNRFIAYLFDDLHMSFGDLAQLRPPAERHINALETTDRAAIFSTSGRTTLDFTDDREQLRETLRRLKPQPQAGVEGCPEMSYYMADQIVNRNDQQIMQALIQEAIVCLSLTGTPAQQAAQAQPFVFSAAQRELSVGEHDSHVAMTVLSDAIRRMAAVPGQRSLVLISPGFLVTTDYRAEETDIIDRAIRSNIIIGSIDARGLYADDLRLDKAQYDARAETVKAQYTRDAARQQDDVLAELASNTGGTFYQNSNDLDEGFRRVATAPEFYYLLGFSPENLKMDGSLHTLKVSLRNSKDLSLQARRAYYAPKHLTDPAQQAKQEIEEALFSRDELHDIPIELHTQFFKSGETDAKLAVLARVDLRNLHFRKAEGRNRNNLQVVSALFDRNGNYITGIEKIVEMRLLDATVENKLRPITVKTSFDVKPGNYVVRLVVRDSEEQLMAAQTSAVDIPY